MVNRTTIGRWVIMDARTGEVVGHAGSMTGCCRQIARADDTGKITWQEVMAHFEEHTSITLTTAGQPESYAVGLTKEETEET